MPRYRELQLKTQHSARITREKRHAHCLTQHFCFFAREPLCFFPKKTEIKKKEKGDTICTASHSTLALRDLLCMQKEKKTQLIANYFLYSTSLWGGYD